jgi:hypothetical protein
MGTAHVAVCVRHAVKAHRIAVQKCQSIDKTIAHAVAEVNEKLGHQAS